MDDWSKDGYDFDSDDAWDTPLDDTVEADDEMARFEAECVRRLAKKHERQAEERKLQASEPQPEAPQTEPEQTFSAREEPSSEASDSDSIVADFGTSYELSQMMKGEAYQREIRDEEAMDVAAEDAEDSAELLPSWLRLLFTALLLVFGALGVTMMTMSDYHSFLLDPICFTEISLCLLLAVGLNASLIPNRKFKVIIMRSAIWFLFLFYCLYAADTLFLDSMIRSGFALGNFTVYAREHISFHLFGDLAHMGGLSMLECMLFIMPYGFFVPLALQSYRNILLYFLYMIFSVLVAGTLRVISMSGSINLAQCLMCMVGATASYVLFMLPPVQNIMRSVGLIDWLSVEDDE